MTALEGMSTQNNRSEFLLQSRWTSVGPTGAAGTYRPERWYSEAWDLSSAAEIEGLFCPKRRHGNDCQFACSPSPVVRRIDDAQPRRDNATSKDHRLR